MKRKRPIFRGRPLRGLFTSCVAVIKKARPLSNETRQLEPLQKQFPCAEIRFSNRIRNCKRLPHNRREYRFFQTNGIIAADGAAISLKIFFFEKTLLPSKGALEETAVKHVRFSSGKLRNNAPVSFFLKLA